MAEREAAAPRTRGGRGDAKRKSPHDVPGEGDATAEAAHALLSAADDETTRLAWAYMQQQRRSHGVSSTERCLIALMSCALRHLFRSGLLQKDPRRSVSVDWVVARLLGLSRGDVGSTKVRMRRDFDAAVVQARGRGRRAGSGASNALASSTLLQAVRKIAMDACMRGSLATASEMQHTLMALPGASELKMSKRHFYRVVRKAGFAFKRMRSSVTGAPTTLQLREDRRLRLQRAAFFAQLDNMRREGFVFLYAGEAHVGVDCAPSVLGLADGAGAGRSSRARVCFADVGGKDGWVPGAFAPLAPQPSSASPGAQRKATAQGSARDRSHESFNPRWYKGYITDTVVPAVARMYPEQCAQGKVCLVMDDAAYHTARQTSFVGSFKSLSRLEMLRVLVEHNADERKSTKLPVEMRAPPGGPSRISSEYATLKALSDAHLAKHGDGGAAFQAPARGMLTHEMLQALYKELVVAKAPSVVAAVCSRRGISVLFTPPMHSTLNPIELAWGALKADVARQMVAWRQANQPAESAAGTSAEQVAPGKRRKNQQVPAATVLQYVQDARGRVTPQLWARFVTDADAQEEAYRDFDQCMEERDQEGLVVDDSSDDSSTTDTSSGGSAVDDDDYLSAFSSDDGSGSSDSES
jgi:hypothetical protein